MYKERPYKVRQGEIYYVDFPESRGSVQKGIRPVIIIQNNRLNRNSTTFVCALITSQIKRLDLHEHVLLPEMKGLPKRSMVMAEQLIDYRGRVDWEIFKKINSAVRICEKTKKEQY